MIGLFSLILLFVTISAGYAAGRLGARRERDSRSGDPELRDLRERLERLEQSMEATTAELERVSESERFLTALLEDRTKGQRTLERPSGESTH